MHGTHSDDIVGSVHPIPIASQNRASSALVQGISKSNDELNLIFEIILHNFRSVRI